MNELLFILPSYGHFDYVRKCYDSFVRNTPQGIYRILFIDDASPDWRENHPFKYINTPSITAHFYENGGLTRSWNEGLRIAKKNSFKYTLCGNSDLLFTEGWYQPLKAALDEVDLVGPITNAPGHAPWQNIQAFCSARLTDDRDYLNLTAKKMCDFPQRVVACDYINGFCMLAKTETWWSGAFNKYDVFDPKYPLTGNEDELQRRWTGLGRKIAFVPRSYVFHYRSVSRPDALANPVSSGAYRDERPSCDDCVRPNTDSELVDAGLGERREISER